jgi:hypothetical protein
VLYQDFDAQNGIMVVRTGNEYTAAGLFSTAHRVMSSIEQLQKLRGPIGDHAGRVVI